MDWRRDWTPDELVDSATTRDCVGRMASDAIASVLHAGTGQRPKSSLVRRALRLRPFVWSIGNLERRPNGNGQDLHPCAWILEAFPRTVTPTSHEPGPFGVDSLGHSAVQLIHAGTRVEIEEYESIRLCVH